MLFGWIQSFMWIWTLWRRCNKCLGRLQDVFFFGWSKILTTIDNDNDTCQESLEDLDCLVVFLFSKHWHWMQGVCHFMSQCGQPVPGAPMKQPKQPLTSCRTCLSVVLSKLWPLIRLCAPLSSSSTSSCWSSSLWLWLWLWLLWLWLLLLLSLLLLLLLLLWLWLLLLLLWLWLWLLLWLLLLLLLWLWWSSSSSSSSLSVGMVFCVGDDGRRARYCHRHHNCRRRHRRSRIVESKIRYMSNVALHFTFFDKYGSSHLDHVFLIQRLFNKEQGPIYRYISWHHTM